MLKNKIVWLVFLFLISGYFLIDGDVLGFSIWDHSNEEPVSIGEFAQCITDSGAKLYGAYWCGHCNAQKEMFGEYAKDLPYVECSDSEGRQTEVCAEAGIEGYPTWVFADGTSQAGRLSFEVLAERTGCKI